VVLAIYHKREQNSLRRPSKKVRVEKIRRERTSSKLLKGGRRHHQKGKTKAAGQKNRERKGSISRKGKDQADRSNGRKRGGTILWRKN